MSSPSATIPCSRRPTRARLSCSFARRCWCRRGTEPLPIFFFSPFTAFGGTRLAVQSPFLSWFVGWFCGSVRRARSGGVWGFPFFFISGVDFVSKRLLGWLDGWMAGWPDGRMAQAGCVFFNKSFTPFASRPGYHHDRQERAVVRDRREGGRKVQLTMGWINKSKTGRTSDDKRLASIHPYVKHSMHLSRHNPPAAFSLTQPCPGPCPKQEAPPAPHCRYQHQPPPRCPPTSLPPRASACGSRQTRSCWPRAGA